MPPFSLVFLLSREEVRSIDARAAEELGLPTLILMENAGRGRRRGWPSCASGPARSRVGDRLCGPGNNGGDGGVVARHLDAWGFPVRVVWFARRDQLRGDAAGPVDDPRAAGDRPDGLADGPRRPPPAELDALLAAADWLVDGLLGTGLTRPVEGLLAAVVEAINRSGKPILALDLPSGLDADTGRPLGVAVRAMTATFVAPKLGFAAPGAADYTGEVGAVDRRARGSRSRRSGSRIDLIATRIFKRDCVTS